MKQPPAACGLESVRDIKMWLPWLRFGGGKK